MAWFKTDTAADYADVSKGTVRNWFGRGLKRSVIGRTVLIRKDDLDDFLESYAKQNEKDAVRVLRIADDVLRQLGGS
jgi:excisionase family DNA binding protein